MAEWLLVALTTIQTELRITALVLTVANLVWMAPLASCAVRGDTSAKSAFFFGIFTGILAWALKEVGYLFRGVPDTLHWWRAANHIILNLGLLVVLASRVIWHVEQRVRLKGRADAD